MSHTTRLARTGNEELVVALARTVAARRGVDPTMCAPLYGSIDPEIIECLPDCADETSVTFEWCDTTVTLWGEMRVEITTE